MKQELLMEIADKIRTPAFVFSKEEFCHKAMKCRSEAAGRFRLCFSVKANPFLTDPYFEPDTLFHSFEACSPGELKICITNRIPPERILYSGVNKTEAEVKAAIALGVSLFTAESRRQLEILNAIGEERGRELSVLLRLSSDSQFGMDEEELCGLIADRNRHRGVYIAGIHYFTGTQKKKVSTIQKETGYLMHLYERIRRETGCLLEFIEYGPGLNLSCFTDQPSFESAFSEALPSFTELAGTASLTIEMGRFFAADCGYYFTKVVDTKSNGGTNYAIVDGGMHQLHYDGQIRGMKIPYCLRITAEQEKNATDSPGRLWTICGSICSNEDVLCRNVPFSDLQPGDILVFQNCGAYSFMEGMTTFLSREMPQIWSFSETDGPILLRDFIATDAFHIRRSRKNDT